MLRTLADTSRDDAAMLIGAALASLLQHPFEESPSTGSEGMVDSILREAAERTKTKIGDARARRYLVRYLSRELSEALLPRGSEALHKVKARLGDKGELHPSLYDVVLSEEQSSLPHQLLPSMVVQAVKNADDWQHIDPDGTAAPGAEPISLFVRRGEVLGARSEYTVLVIAKRSGDVLTVFDALLVPHGELDLEHVVTPLDFLAHFAERFGFEVSVAGVGKQKFVRYVRVEVPAVAGAANIERLVTIHAEENRSFKVTAEIKVSDAKNAKAQFVDIALLYALDIDQYMKTLEHHGLRDRSAIESKAPQQR